MHPRRWWMGLMSYHRYLGYIKPFLKADSEEEYFIRRKAVSKSWAPRRLSFPVAHKILVISPHPDDESIGAGGLLWAHRDVSEIHFIVLCKGEKGGRLEGPYENTGQYKLKLAAARKDEFYKTSSALKARSCHFFDFPDGEIPCSQNEADKLRDLVKKIDPDIVFLPWLFDDWPDHRRANALYALGCADLEYMVFAYEVWTMLEPNAIFDISGHIDGKRSLIKNYESQLRIIDYLSYCEGLSKVRAFQYSNCPDKGGAIEAYLALPNNEYCELARYYYDKSKSSK